MNNLLCCILFCLTASRLVNADCSTSPSVPNATINEQHQCGDITIRCDKGFIMNQVTQCKDGEWKYQEPFCKPQECGYSFTNKTNVYFKYIESIGNQNETECDKQCNDNTECSTTYLNGNLCFLYPAPLISRSLDTNLDQCITKCTQMVECLMVSHWRGSQRCNMFNVTMSNLPDEGFSVEEGHDDDYIVAEKYCL